MCSTLAPSHLLFLHHPFAHDLIDCRLSRRKPTVLNLMPPGISRSPPTCSDPCWRGSAAMRVPAGYRAIAQRVVARLVEVSALGNDGSFLTQKST
jgi:hypothetical protein